jgi:hypothetical protein
VLCESGISGLGLCPQNLSRVLPSFCGCDQTYETWSTGSESNINEEELERQKRRGS